MSYIGLIDCNNFFVSCERLFRPDLRNKPVLVLSSNDGCVVARSQEIKDIGIQMGVPYFQVKDILKDSGAVAFSSNFTLYRDISRRVFDVAKRYLMTIEQYSIDECFFNLPEEGAHAIAEKVRARILLEVGIPVSVGIGRTKTIAKYASKLAKKTDGVCVLKDSGWQNIIANVGLGEVWGIGSGRVRQFSSHKIYSVAQLCSLPSSTVLSLFGKEGLKLWSELTEKSVLPVSTNSQRQKTLMSSRSLQKATFSKSVVAEALSFHVYQIVTDLVKQGSLASEITVIMYPSRHGDFVLQGTSLKMVLPIPVNDIFVLDKAVKELLNQGFKIDVPYKRIGVMVTGLIEIGKYTMPLFSVLQPRQTNELTKTILSLNQRFGKTLIGLGSLPKAGSLWQTRQDMKSAAYTTDWQGIKKVSAA